MWDSLLMPPMALHCFQGSIKIPHMACKALQNLVFIQAWNAASTTNKAVKIFKSLCAPPMALCPSSANPIAHAAAVQSSGGRKGASAGIWHWLLSRHMLGWGQWRGQHSLETPLHGRFWELQLWQYTTLIVKCDILNNSPASVNFTRLIVHHDLVHVFVERIKERLNS